MGFSRQEYWSELPFPLPRDLADTGIKPVSLVSPDLEKRWKPTPVLLPGKSHGQRNLVGYGPWGHKELDMTEVT